MKSKLVNYAIAVGILFGLTESLPLAAQNANAPKPKHQQYKLYDFGTFGGPNSYVSNYTVTLTAAGAIAASDTSLADPFDPNCFIDCFVAHAALWRNGQVTDIGALPGNNGGNSSYAFAINNWGLAVGISENGAIDPATGYPDVDAVIWQDGRIFDLGTFGGTQSEAFMVNDSGQVAGSALNAVPDPYSLGGWFPGTTQSRAFVWDKGFVRDLGTLGGPDAVAYNMSDSGKIAGLSYTNNIPNADTGVPTLHPFLWKDGKMIDLGSFGGTLCNEFDVNNQGQVVGYSFLAGDEDWEGFIWDDGVMKPATLGGKGAFLGWVNEAADAVGGSYIPGNQFVHVMLWSKGKVYDLGVVGQDLVAQAFGINASQQIVGESRPDGQSDSTQRAFLWEKGDIVDLNALIENPSGLHVQIGWYITDSGQIYGQATDSKSNRHTVVLIPDGGCEGACEQRIAEFENRTLPSLSPSSNIPPQFAGVPASGRPNHLTRFLEAHQPNANPAQPK